MESEDKRVTSNIETVMVAATAPPPTAAGRPPTSQLFSVSGILKQKKENQVIKVFHFVARQLGK